MEEASSHGFRVWISYSQSYSVNPNGGRQDPSPSNRLDIRLLERLDSLDGVRDNQVECEKLLRTLKIVDQHRKTKTYKQIRTMIRTADRNNDGFLDRSEFFEFVDNINKSDNKKLNLYLEKVANAEKYRWCPPPWYTLVIIIAQIGFSVFHTYHFRHHPAHRHDPIVLGWNGPYQVCSKLIFNPHRRYELWRYLSYFLVHAGYRHLVVNTCIQLLVGLPLEMTNGFLRVAFVYLVGILAGSLSTTVFVPSAYLAGSSGAGFALVGANLASLVLNWSEDDLVVKESLRDVVSGFNQQVKKFPMRSKCFRIIKVVFIAFLCIVDSSTGTAMVSFIVHLSGFLAGFLAGIVTLKNRKVHAWELKMQMTCIFLLSLLALAALVWCILANEIWMGIYHKNFFLQQDFRKIYSHTGNCTYHD